MKLQREFLVPKVKVRRPWLGRRLLSGYLRFEAWLIDSIWGGR